MGCGCSQNPGAKVWEFIYTNTRGEETTYKSEYEAKAAKLRGGGNYRAVEVT